VFIAPLQRKKVGSVSGNEKFLTADDTDVADELWLASDADALQLDTGFGAPSDRTSTFCDPCYPCNPWWITSTSPRRAFGKRDRRAKGPRSDQA